MQPEASTNSTLGQCCEDPETCDAGSEFVPGAITDHFSARDISARTASDVSANHRLVSGGRRMGVSVPLSKLRAASRGFMNCWVSLPSRPAKVGRSS